MNNPSLRDEVLSNLPEASHKGILELALDYGVNNPDDPVWAMVGLAWSAAKGADLTRERLEIIRRETASIPEKITKGTEQAGANLRTIINTEITEKMDALRGTLVKDIDRAAGKGAEAIRKAQDGLDNDIEKIRMSVGESHFPLSSPLGGWCGSSENPSGHEDLSGARPSMIGRLKFFS